MPSLVPPWDLTMLVLERLLGRTTACSMVPEKQLRPMSPRLNAGPILTAPGSDLSPLPTTAIHPPIEYAWLIWRIGLFNPSLVG
jgi:hypothetical protein